MHIFTSSLRSQITLLSVLLVLITTVVIQTVSWWSANAFNEQQIRQDVASASRVLAEYSALREELLINASGVLAADFGFKQAVATREADTIQSVLENHGQRINADLMLITDLDGQLIANSQQKTISAEALQKLVSELLLLEGQAQIVLLDNQLYQLILQPIKTPRTIAFNLVGFEINQQTLQKLTDLTGLEISFLVDNKPVLSSLSQMQSDDAVPEQLDTHVTTWMTLKRPTFINTFIAVNTASFNPVEILLTTDMRPIHQEYDAVASRIISIAIVFMLIAMAIGAYLSNSMIKPLSRLADVAKQFARGQYELPKGALVKASSEISQLGSALQQMGRDIESREKKISYQADHDTLTGLFNAHKFRQLLTENTHNLSDKRLHIALYIENFRQINDRLGPEFADECIRIIARRIQSTQHPLASIHARLDGIEFISVFELDASMQPATMVESFLAQLEQPVHIKEVVVQLNFFCGVTFSPEDGDTPQILLRRTRIAADYARANRKRIHCYEPGQDEERLHELFLVEALNLALVENSDELFLHFQPKMDLSTADVHTVETLIRWHRPGTGNIAPDMFIDLAEQSGLIVQLTHWVVEKTFTQLHRWHQKGLKLQVAINVSAEDVCHSGFSDLMINTAKKFAIEPHYCVIEITERDIMHDEVVGLMTLRALKQAGFKVALDDYGIGQSALFKLKNLPIDELKLDKTFIMRLDQSPADQNIVSSTITMAHKLGLKVVAEGVENAASLALLNEMGCDAVQGYFLSKPLSAEHLEKWLETNNAKMALSSGLTVSKP